MVTTKIRKFCRHTNNKIKIIQHEIPEQHFCGTTIRISAHHSDNKILPKNLKTRVSVCVSISSLI
jgi:hypothetical protein